MYVASFWVFLIVLSVCFCTGHFVMVPLNIIKHFVFELLLNLYSTTSLLYILFINFIHKPGTSLFIHCSIIALCKQKINIKQSLLNELSIIWATYRSSAKSIMSLKIIQEGTHYDAGFLMPSYRCFHLWRVEYLGPVLYLLSLWTLRCYLSQLRNTIPNVGVCAGDNVIHDLLVVDEC